MSQLEALRHVLERTNGVRLAVMFGSRARGRTGRSSDWDIGVSVELGSATTLDRLQVDLERASGGRVDVVLLDEAPPLLRHEVARDGVVLVDQSGHGWADFRAKAMIDWWDWAPTARMMHRVMAERLRAEAAGGQA